MSSTSSVKGAVKLVLTLLGAMTLFGCNSSSFLSGASSMRIDVDVYKGALSNTTPIQKGQLQVVLQSADLAIEDADGQLVASMCRIGCVQRERAADFEKEYMPSVYDKDEYDKKKAMPGLLKKHVAPEFYRNALTPGVAQCEKLGIPQRRALNHDAWIGKTYKPYKISGPYDYNERTHTYSPPELRSSSELKEDDFSEGYAEEAHALYESLIADDSNCLNENGKKQSKKNKCKGGFFGLRKRVVSDLGDVEAAPIENTRGQLNSSSRFPEFKGKTYQICPVYVRLRTQLKTIEAVLEIDKPKAERFEVNVDKEKAVAEINQAVGIQYTLLEDSICGTGPESVKCKKAFVDYQKAASAVKSANLGKGVTPPPTGGNPTAAEAYLLAAENLKQRVDRILTEAKAGQRAAGSAINTTQQQAAITDFAGGLIDARDTFIMHQTKPIDPSPISGAIGTWKAIGAPTVMTLDTWSTNLDLVRHAFAAAKSGYDRQVTDVESVNKLYTDNKTKNLKTYFVKKNLSNAELRKAVQRANDLKAHLISIDGELSKVEAIVKSEIEARNEQNALKTALQNERQKFSGYKPPTTLAELQSINEKFRGGVTDIRKLTERAKATRWNNAQINPIEIHLNDVINALDGMPQLSDWTNGAAESANASNLRSKANTLTSVDFPDLSSLPAPKIASLTVDGRDKLDQLVNGPGKTLAAFGTTTTGLAQSFTAAELPKELNDTVVAIQGDGLSPEFGPTRKTLDSTRQSLKDQIELLEIFKKDLDQGLRIAEQLQAVHENAAYQKVALIAGSFRVLATAISYQIASVEPKDKRLLIDMAKTANMAAEFANQLTSRANALSLQAQGLDRRTISTGQYLRDTQPTAFLETYDWLNAATRGAVSPRDRISVAKRLFADDNWARINQVYASGAGRTNIAFIKDEIGNWNLKSFENDPTEITTAYSRLGADLVERAAAIAATGGTSEAVDTDRIGKLLKTAQDAQTGGASSAERSGALISNLDLESVREGLVAKLVTVEDDRVKRLATINGWDLESDDIQQIFEGIDPNDTAQKTQKLEEHKTTQTAEANTTARDKIKTVVSEYENLITALQTVAAVKPKKEGDQPD